MALDLEPIEKRVASATSGRWEIKWSALSKRPLLGLIRGREPIVYWGYRHGDNAWNDLEFIAHAREDIPALVAEIKRLRRERSGN